MGYSLRMALHVSQVRSSTKKNKQSYEKEIRRQKREQEARKGSGHQLRCLALQSSLRKRLLRFLVAGDIKVKVQARVGLSSLPLESKPSRSPLGANLIPQTRYSSVLLNNQSFLPLNIPSQPMALLSQAFNGACILASFTTGSIQQRCLIT